MNNKSRLKKLIAMATGVFLLTGRPCQATPYASGITNNAGTVSFFLNEDAEDVKVIFNSGTGLTNNMGALVRGKYSFALGANTNFSILVTKASGAGFKSDTGSGVAGKLPISGTTNRYLNFESPRGLKVNRNPSSPYFGRIYTSNSRTTATGLTRPMQTGVYAINPDYTSAHAAGFEDTALTANLPSVSGGPMGASFPYELAIGQDDNLYLCDWTDSTGNLWVTDPDVINGVAVLKPLSALNTAKVPVGVNNTHGSVNAAHIEGSLAANNLTVWTIDEDLQTDKTTTNRTELSSLWRYDVGAASPYVAEPTKLWTASGKQGIATAAQTGDMVRSTNGNFYIIDNRSAGDESGLAIVSATGTPLWDSWTASQVIRAGKDILTNSWKVAVSYDDKYVAVARATGIVWIIPLINGIPDLSQRLILTPFSVGSSIRGLAFDAAGNLYVDSNSSEFIGVFSPGGTTVAVTVNDTTGVNGGFYITAPATTVSVAPTIAIITENGGTNGVFTVTRVGDTSVALTVPYTVSGTATNGVDYTVVVGSVTLQPFQSSTNIFVTPSNDGTAELTETVVLSLQGGAGFSVGSPGSATVSILDDEMPQIAFSTITTNKLLESYAPSKVNLQLIRRGLLATNLAINLTYGGVATWGADFNATNAVALASNAVTTTVTLTPINDQAYEGDELAVASVTNGTGYVIGTTNSAYALVVDDEYPAGAVLFSDDFNGINSSNQWAINLADPTTDFVEFNWDYSAYGIPLAPGTTDGSALGMRMRCGNTILQFDGLSLSPTNGNFTGNYRLKFDMWINYNGPMPDGGPGSTQNFDAGVGTTGDRVVWFNSDLADGIWFTATGDGADGDADGDYTAFIGNVQFKDDTGFYAAGTGAGPNTGLRNATHSFYSLWGGQAAPAAQLALYPNQTGVAFAGNAGMAWHTVVITKVADTVKWQIDGITICTVTNDPSGLSTNVFVGYQDKFASGSLSDVPEMSFGLVDNLRVETYISAPIHITNIQIDGGNVIISFTGPAESVAADFTLESATTVDGEYSDDEDADPDDLGSGSFKFTTALSGGASYYKIKL